MQVVNLLDFRTVGGERHSLRVLLAAIPARRRVVVVRAGVDEHHGVWLALVEIDKPSMPLTA